MDVIQTIADDNELRQLLMKVFKWRNPSNTGFNLTSLNIAVCELADTLWEKYGIDLEIYT